MMLDEAREALPHCGFAVYAMDPSGEVTLEIHLPEGEMITLRADSEAEVWALAFPEPEEDEPVDLFDLNRRDELERLETFRGDEALPSVFD